MSDRNLAAAAEICSARLSSAQSPAARVEKCLRSVWHRLAAWRRRGREHKELLEFLASDHRIAADIGYRHHDE